MSRLGDKLRQLRGRDSLETASRKIGVGMNYLASLEKGFDQTGKPVQPDIRTLEAISKAYNYEYILLVYYAGYIDDIVEKLLVRASRSMNGKDLSDYLFMFNLEVLAGTNKDNFFNIETWRVLSDSDKREIAHHFKWVLNSAKNRKMN